MKNEVKHTLVYGLSADPVHQMHVEIVVDAAKRLTAFGFDIARILIIPVYRRNPVGSKRKDALVATFEHRFAMCELAANEISQRLNDLGGSVEVSRVEQKLAQGTENPNYTVETLQALQEEKTPAMNWVLLLGSDLVSSDDPELQHWRQVERLVQLATIAIYPRPGHQINTAFLRDMEKKGARFVHLHDAAQSNIQSSQIRQRLDAGCDPYLLRQEGHLPESVALYIRQHGLYHGSEREPVSEEAVGKKLQIP